MEQDVISAPAAAPKGRPREFCVDQALAEALHVFWAKGYDGASMTDLTEAMGITKPSLYAAFGNKEALFHKALDLYEREKLEYGRAALEQPTARKVAEYYLRGAIEIHGGTSDPKGCMGLISSLACSPEAESIKADVVRRRASSQRLLVERFERAKAEGDIPAHVDAEGLTSVLYALLQGITVQAGAGATHAELERLVDTSMTLWPSP
ncbi:TetR family transcriptional regulator [Sphingopyxis sp. QXT-31]|uniref:TetR/AcrR family transcriptional regulator n=1 Tax=Sphingopyxis sp. QXT-31 TaxID=1357916 RepID=UPI0009790592|nr:TetR/AcrR family transcriptional regulator [Sphingopyxis sp. QXT-31]APZ97198.1 TetR family transcriptional regulator [Sphingopyxis sp. QXT-31]